MTSLTQKIAGYVIPAALSIGAATAAYSYFIPDKVTVTITDTTVKRNDGEDRYIVFTDKGPFENTEAWYRFKFSSTEMQNDLVELKGQQVELTKYGWRFQLLSWYENIVDIEVQDRKSK